MAGPDLAIFSGAVPRQMEGRPTHDAEAACVALQRFWVLAVRWNVYSAGTTTLIATRRGMFRANKAMIALTPVNTASP